MGRDSSAAAPQCTCGASLAGYSHAGRARGLREGVPRVYDAHHGHCRYCGQPRDQYRECRECGEDLLW